MLLELENVSVSYGPIQAVRDVSLRVGSGEVVAILGANGAGKSTILSAISGLLRPRGGLIRFADRRIDRLRPEKIVKLGLTQAPEGRRLFGELTVAENLDLGAYTLRDKSAKRANLQRVLRYFPVLKERRRQKAATLSGGQQQMVAVARSLMSWPRLLMLDEPSLGLAPMLVDQIFEIIRTINQQEGVAVLLVEQNANEALLHADRAYVLEAGRVILEGSAAEMRSDPRMIEAYLGA